MYLTKQVIGDVEKAALSGFFCLGGFLLAGWLVGLGFLPFDLTLIYLSFGNGEDLA